MLLMLYCHIINVSQEWVLSGNELTLYVLEKSTVCFYLAKSEDAMDNRYA